MVQAEGWIDPRSLRWLNQGLLADHPLEAVGRAAGMDLSGSLQANPEALSWAGQ